MTQRLYLGKNTALDIGAVMLTPVATSVSIADESTFERLRAMGENASDVEFLKGGRSLSLAGVYYGDEADALRALVGGADVQPWRLVLDVGQSDQLMAGQCLVGGLTLEAPTASVLVVTGPVPVTGTTYIGSGRYEDNAARSVGVAFDTVVFARRSAGTLTSGTTVGTVTVTATAGADTFSAAEDLPTDGLYLVRLPLTSGGTPRPTSGSWEIAIALTGWDVEPLYEWGIVRGGTFLNAQNVYLGKDIYLAMGTSASSLTEVSGQGNGLTSVGFGDDVATVEKMGTGNYRERQSGEVHAYTVSIVVQLGDVTYPLISGQQGVLQYFDFGPRGNAANNPKFTFSGFINLGTTSYAVGTPEVPVTVTVEVNGEVVEGTY